jgi:hypothetical protein
MVDGDVVRSARVRRYGVDRELPAQLGLRAGPVTVVLEGGDLRYVTVGGVEVVRRLYVGVRNRNWATIEPRYARYEVDEGPDRFAVRFTAVHQDGDVDFTWDGTIVGSADGTIEAAMDGVVGSDFLRNRIGFCVLHPMALAGTPAVVETPDGTHEAVFPDLISPHQPFLEMISLSHPIGDTGGRVTIRFEGDLFEDEDQRNWTDASYKTYSTPLRIPYPVEVKRGQEIRQRVTISIDGDVQPRGDDRSGSKVDVTIGIENVGALPPIGLGAARHRAPLTQAAVAALRAVKPAHLWTEVDLSDPDWVDGLARASREARALETGLEIWAVADEAGGDGLDRLANGLTEVAQRTPIRRVLVFPHATLPVKHPWREWVTSAEVFVRAKAAFVAVGLDVPLGGGARTYFTEFNRARESMPLGEMAVVGYTINPQVHAFDNASLVETLAAQAETVRSARAIAGQTPLVVGPVTLKPPFNPNATVAVAEPGPDRLPDSVDPRQLSLFGAGWTLGSIRHLAQAGVDSLTYYETTGWRGLIERTDDLTRRDLFPSRPSGLFPLYHVFAALAEFGGGEVLTVELGEPLATEALAVRSGDRIRALVASFLDAERPVTISLPALHDARVKLLDETTYDAAVNDASFFLTGGETIDATGGTIALTLRPFAVAWITGGMAEGSGG